MGSDDRENEEGRMTKDYLRMRSDEGRVMNKEWSILRDEAPTVL